MTAAPNLHPLVVHFPIVLVALALILAVASRIRPWSAHRRWRTGAWLLAASAATGAFLTGRVAADGLVDVPAMAQATLAEHADLALLVVAASWTTALLELAGNWLEGPARTAAGWLALLTGFGANAAVVLTADHGGALVFRHAVAVRAPECPACEGPPSTPSRSGSPVVSDDGKTVTWTATPAQLAGLGAAPWPAQGVAMAVDGRHELLLPGVLGDVQVNVWLDPGSFQGTVQVLHHVGEDGVGEDSAGAFTLYASGDARLETLGPTPSVLAERVAQRPERAISVSATGGHFKGMVDGKVVAHGHGPSLPPGRVGVRFDGSGVVGLQRVEAVRLDTPSP